MRLELLDVFHVLQVFLTLLDVLGFDSELLSLFNSCLNLTWIGLVLSNEIQESFFLLLSSINHVSVALSVFENNLVQSFLQFNSFIFNILEGLFSFGLS